MLSAIITVILFSIAFLITVFIRDKYLYSSYAGIADQSKEPYLDILRTELKTVFKNVNGWINAIYSGLVYAPTGAFAALWGISFLQESYQINLGVSAFVVSMIFLGWAVCGPIIGWISDKIKKRKPMMFFLSALGVVTLSIIIYAPNLPLPVLFIVAFFYGAANSGVSLAYAVAGEINTAKASGLSIAFTNMFSILTVPGLQQMVGWLLVLGWTHETLKGAPVYGVRDYHHALLILPLCLLVAFFCVFLIKEPQRR